MYRGLPVMVCAVLSFCVGFGCSASKSAKRIGLPAKKVTHMWDVHWDQQREISDLELRERILHAISQARLTDRKGTSQMSEWIIVDYGGERYEFLIMRVGPAAEVYWKDSWYASKDLYDLLEKDVDKLPSTTLTPR